MFANRVASAFILAICIANVLNSRKLKALDQRLHRVVFSAQGDSFLCTKGELEPLFYNVLFLPLSQKRALPQQQCIRGKVFFPGAGQEK